MNDFEIERESPLPDTVDGLRDEVLALRKMLRRERRLLAKQWEMRMLESKETDKLRKQVAELQGILKELESSYEKYINSIGG